MKKTVLVLIMVLLHIAAVNLYAAGDLIVEGQVATGTTDGIATPLNTLRAINISQSWDTSSTVFSGLFRATNYGTGNIFGFSTKGLSTHSSGTRDWAFGGYYMAVQKGTGTVANLEGVHAMTGGNGTGAVTYNTPLDIMGRLGNAATTAARGIYIRDFRLRSYAPYYETGSSVTNYGIYMDKQTTGTNNYQIYSVGGQSYLGGSLGIGTTNPQSALQVNGYTQLALTSGGPPLEDCDEASERGRMKIDSTAGSLYICVDSGWVSK